MPDRMWKLSAAFIGGPLMLFVPLWATNAESQSRSQIEYEVRLQITRPCFETILRENGQNHTRGAVDNFIELMRVIDGGQELALETHAVDTIMEMARKSPHMRERRNRMAIYPIWRGSCIDAGR